MGSCPLLILLANPFELEYCPCKYRISKPSRHAGERLPNVKPYFASSIACYSNPGYEAMNMVRKGQIANIEKGAVCSQREFVESLFGLAA